MKSTTCPTHYASCSKASSMSYFKAPHASFRFPQIRDSTTAAMVIFRKRFYCFFGHLVFDHLVHIRVRTHTRNDEGAEALVLEYSYGDTSTDIHMYSIASLGNPSQRANLQPARTTSTCRWDHPMGIAHPFRIPNEFITMSCEEELDDVSQRFARQCSSCTYAPGLVLECFSRISSLQES